MEEYRIIKIEDMGDTVVKLQQLLNKVGYCLDETGIFDKMTEMCVADFQRKNGLMVDRIVGPNTWKKLYELTK